MRETSSKDVVQKAWERQQLVVIYVYRVYEVYFGQQTPNMQCFEHVQKSTVNTVCVCTRNAMYKIVCFGKVTRPIIHYKKKILLC